MHHFSIVVLVCNKAKGQIWKWVFQEKKSMPNFPKNEHFFSPDTHTKFGVLCFLETPVLRFALQSKIFKKALHTCFVHTCFVDCCRQKNLLLKVSIREVRWISQLVKINKICKIYFSWKWFFQLEFSDFYQSELSYIIVSWNLYKLIKKPYT